MDFSITFIEVFLIGLLYASPLIIFFFIVIAVLGLWVGRREGWNRYDSLYYAFVTATTVGYGDMRPVSRFSKFLAIKIAFTGLVFTGIFVSIAVNAASIAFKETQDIERLKGEMESFLEERVE